MYVLHGLINPARDILAGDMLKCDMHSGFVTTREYEVMIIFIIMLFFLLFLAFSTRP